MTPATPTRHHETHAAPGSRPRPPRDVVRCQGFFTWTFTCTIVSGALALMWLLLRSGRKPSRFAYPCQQAAFGFAAAAFGAPIAATCVTLRRQLAALLRPTAGRMLAGGLAFLGIALLTSASGNCVSEIPVVILDPPTGYAPDVFLINNARGIEPGRYGGVDDLITLMGTNGLKWHRTETAGATAGPDGLIDADDVVLLKISAQWPERGGTNTDVLRGVIRRIVEHPDGFVGEIIVADNGQGVGDLDRAENNAEDRQQSPQDVANDFAAEGWNVSTMLWDALRSTSVGEYADGDMASGYVVAATRDPETQIKVSYPKFQSASGTYISYKYGVWSPAAQTYDSDKLVVINMPLLKTHFIYGISASVKNHMGVVTNSLSTDSHSAVGRGGMGTILADVRMPDLSILDCIWVLARPGLGPYVRYEDATRTDQLVAGTDPVALDAWAAKFILRPQILANGYAERDDRAAQDPDNPDGAFRKYLDRSMNELVAAGIDTTNDYNAVHLHVAGDAAPTSE